MALPDVCREVREFASLRKKKEKGKGRADFNQTSQKCSLGYPDPNCLATFLYLIFKVKTSGFRPKTYISTHSEHVQPNFVKFGNNVLAGTLYTSADTIVCYFNF